MRDRHFESCAESRKSIGFTVYVPGTTPLGAVPAGTQIAHERLKPPRRTPGSPFVDVAAMSERDDDNQEHLVVDRVDDAIATDPNAETGSALQGARGRWAWVPRQ